MGGGVPKVGDKVAGLVVEKVSIRRLRCSVIAECVLHSNHYNDNDNNIEFLK